MLILLSDAFGPRMPDRLARFGEVTEDKSRLPEANVVLIRSKTKATREYIDSAPNLELIIRGGVGMDNIDIPYAESKGIRCLNTADASTNAVAETDESDNVISRTFTWIQGDSELRFHPTGLVTVINPALKRADALKLATQPLTRREIHLPVVSAELNDAMNTGKSGEMLRVMIVPAERLDPTAMGTALKDASRATRRQVILDGARQQMDTAHALLATDLNNLVKSGLALEAEPLWLPGMIAMQMSAPAGAKLALNPARFARKPDPRKPSNKPARNWPIS